MFKVDIAAKQLLKLTPRTFAELGLMERFDVQEWIVSRPDILHEDLLILAKEYILPSRIRLDVLALDKAANLVVVELKRDDSGSDVEWQAIKYASYCSNFAPSDIFEIFAGYLKTDTDDAQLKIEEFIEPELDSLNEKQRIILVAREFHSDVASAVLWLRDHDVDIKCVRLRAHTDNDGDLFLNPEVIIPLPEAKDYIERREAKKQETRSQRGERIVETLFRRGVLRTNTRLHLVRLPRAGLNIPDNAKLATFEGTGTHGIKWDYDGGNYSLSLLCKKVCELGDPSRGAGPFQGPAYWGLVGESLPLTERADTPSQGSASQEAPRE